MWPLFIENILLSSSMRRASKCSSPMAIGAADAMIYRLGRCDLLGSNKRKRFKLALTIHRYFHQRLFL